jgi:hypothetical protein
MNEYFVPYVFASIAAFLPAFNGLFSLLVAFMFLFNKLTLLTCVTGLLMGYIHFQSLPIILALPMVYCETKVKSNSRPF